jgi:hypothetical protein
MFKNQKGFVIPLIIAIIAILVVGGGVFVYNNKKVEAPIVDQDIVTNVDIAKDWKTYTNTQYGFSFQYPVEYDLNDHTTESSRPFFQLVSKIDGYFISIDILSRDSFWCDEISCEPSRYELKENLVIDNKPARFILYGDVGGYTDRVQILNKNILVDISKFVGLGKISVKDIAKTFKFITPQVACTMDAKMCPDGSYVGRTGPNCEFVCPKTVTTNNNSTKLNQKTIINGLEITPLKVISDSRCNDVCIWAGTVILQVELKNQTSTSTALTLGTPVIFQGKEITLVGVSPEVGQIKPLLPEEYSFEFLVK